MTMGAGYVYGTGSAHAERKEIASTSHSDSIKMSNSDIAVAKKLAHTLMRSRSPSAQPKGRSKKSIPCKFYQEGTCTKGNDCLYLHEK